MTFSILAPHEGVLYFLCYKTPNFVPKHSYARRSVVPLLAVFIPKTAMSADHSRRSRAKCYNSPLKPLSPPSRENAPYRSNHHIQGVTG